MKDVTENGVCKYRAAKKFGIPRSTLIRKLSGKGSLDRKMGPQTILTEAEEKTLEEWLLATCRKGFPMQRFDLLLAVQKVVEESKRKTCFKAGMPGRTWFKSFMRRHPNVNLKYTESVAKSRSDLTTEVIDRWFSDVLKYLREENLEEILQHPNRIFNGAVCDFQLDLQNRKVLGPPRYDQAIYERIPNYGKKQVALMATCSASGESVPPMIIFPNNKFPMRIANLVPGNWAIGRSDSGCITSEVFYEYIGNHFLTYLRSHNIQKPVLLFVDGLRIHFTKEVSELCDLNGVIMMSVHPNATHILQPTDVSIFKPLNLDWYSIARKWKLDNRTKYITKHSFGKVIASVFENYWCPETVKNGFKQCGLFPFDSKQIEYNNKWIDKGNVTCSHLNGRKDNSESHLDDILSEIEKRIDPEELIRFKDTYYNNDQWSCNIESEELYNLWFKAKRDLENNCESVQQTERKVLDESQNEVKYIVESFMQ